MSMGLGHEYWVHIIKYTSGSLEKCIKFMKLNKPTSNKQWFELIPRVNVKEGTCEQYMCNLVELDNK